MEADDLDKNRFKRTEKTRGLNPVKRSRIESAALSISFGDEGVVTKEKLEFSVLIWRPESEAPRVSEFHRRTMKEGI